MPTPDKEARVAAFRETLAEGCTLYLSDFSGITAAQMNELRGKVLAAGGRVEVAKNRLLKLALTGTPAEVVIPHLVGPTAVVFCQGDPIAPAKAMKDFSKTLTAASQHWVIKAAYVDGRMFAGEKAEALAALPSIDEIKGAAVGAIAGPLNALVGTLNGALSDLVYTLQAIADKRAEQAA